MELSWLPFAGFPCEPGQQFSGAGLFLFVFFRESRFPVLFRLWTSLKISQPTMEDDSRDRIPNLQLQPPSVDFIDNQLPRHHPLFQNPPVHYDPILKHYVPNNLQSPVRRSFDLQQHSMALRRLSTGPGDTVIAATEATARPTWTGVEAMRLWNELFPAALARFKETTVEPKSQVNKKYSIRNLHDWKAIKAKLEASQSAYQQEGTESYNASASFTKIYRKVADKMAPVAEGSRNITRAIPDSVFSAPVLGTIQIICDVC